MTNFLQQHYNRARDAGEDHAMYVVYNDLEDETGRKLKVEYDKLRAEVPPRPDLPKVEGPALYSAGTAFREAMSGD